MYIYPPILKKDLADHTPSEAMGTRRWIRRRNGNQDIIENTDIKNKLVVTSGQKERGKGHDRGMGLSDTNYFV